MASQGKVLLERLRSEVLVLDGAMGTMLFAAGLTPGACPELWNAERPEVLQGVHRAYFEAGSDLVETNTFGGTRLKLKAYGLEDGCRELNEKGAKLARSVCPPGRFVAGSIGPTGHLPDTFEPLGDTPAELFYESFREQALALADGGVDLFAIETMMIPDEAVLAIKAAKEATGLPVLCSMTFQYNAAKGVDRTMWGTSPADAAAALAAAGADVVACNCGDGGPGRVPAILAEMRTATPAFLAAYPNAGIPKVVGDKTIYDLTPEAMAAAFPAIVAAGARIVGACCGSTPAHIKAIAEVVPRACGAISRLVKMSNWSTSRDDRVFFELTNRPNRPSCQAGQARAGSVPPRGRSRMIRPSSGIGIRPFIPMISIPKRRPFSSTSTSIPSSTFRVRATLPSWNLMYKASAFWS